MELKIRVSERVIPSQPHDLQGYYYPKLEDLNYENTIVGVKWTYSCEEIGFILNDGPNYELTSLGPFVGETLISPRETGVYPSFVTLYTRHCDSILVGVRFYDQDMTVILHGGRTDNEISLSITIPLK